MRFLFSLAATAALILITLSAPSEPRRTEVTFELIGRYDTGLSKRGSEIVSYDPASRRMLTVNPTASTVDIVDLNNPAMPALIRSIDVTAFGPVANSVDAADGIIAVAVAATETQNPGNVVFYDSDGGLLGSVEVGALPDMVTFSPDAQRVLVANTGEPDGTYAVDPVGTVSIIDLTGGVADATVTHVGFEDFNTDGPRGHELPADVRIFGPGASVAQDLEPEYIALTPDGATAYVSLQENNALAIIDVNSGIVESIAALGFKHHGLPGNGLDASNRDAGVNITNWPIFGMYQPDAIAAFSTGGKIYVISANEGETRDYRGFSEEARVGDLNLDTDAFPNAARLQMDANLGRLRTTTTLGDHDGDGDFDAIYSYGARSFSIWDGDDGALVYESGDHFERIIATLVPDIFNGNPDGSFDSRSDDKGPEPEAVVVGRVGDRLLAFIALERAGGIMLYDVSDPTEPQFILYQPSAAGDLSPEGLEFIPATTSPNSQPLVLVSHEVSGTVSVYQVGPAEFAPIQDSATFDPGP